jgi:hypothetical protein
MRFAPLIAASAFVILAGRSLSAQDARPERVETAQTINGVSVRIERTDDMRSRTEQLGAPVDSAWAAVTAAYAELRIPGAAVDSAAHSVTVTEQRLRRAGGRSVVTLFDCGGGYGNSAAQYDVYATITTRVAAVAGGSQLRTSVAAYGRSSAGSTTLVCTSNGSLEALIAERVRQHLPR